MKNCFPNKIILIRVEYNNWEQIMIMVLFYLMKRKKKFNQYMKMNDVFNFAKDNTSIDYEDKELLKFFEKKD